jgi:vacuolar-type H+-ATPase subunit F/Vma7
LKRAELIARRFLALEIPDPKSKEAENIREMIRDVLDVRDEDLEGE